MTSSTQLRAWWDAWECDKNKYVRHEFPGDGRVWNLWVADASENAWDRFTDLMVEHDYMFISSAGGTYNCRNIGGTNVRSLHAYAIAVDLNPDVNKYKTTRHNYPQQFIDDVEAVETNNGKTVFAWGGRWSTAYVDTMHWQINCAPEDLATGIKEETVPTYRTVLNVPDKDWARGVVDRSIDQWGTIVTTDGTVDDWENMDMTDGRFWTMTDRAFTRLHPDDDTTPDGDA